MRLEKRAHVPPALIVAAPIAAVVAALLLSGVLIRMAGAPLLEAYWRILVGAFGSRLSITETLTRATPLILNGLSAAVAFRARLWNIGAEGQFYVGALAANACGTTHGLHLPAPLLIPTLLLIGAAAASLLLVPLGLRLRFGVDEVVTTLLLNFVAVLFVSMMINGPLKDPLAFGWPQSTRISAAAALPSFVAHSRLHIGLVIAVCAAGTPVARSIAHPVRVEIPDGGIESAGRTIRGRRSERRPRESCLPIGRPGGSGRCDRSDGAERLCHRRSLAGLRLYRDRGCDIAVLNPFGVILAALYVAVMFVGVDGISRALGVPSFLADVVVSLSLLTMLLAVLCASYRIRR